MSVHIGQDYASQINANKAVYTGNPGSSGDGINWPYDPNGNTPDPSQFQINWNSTPPPTAQQIEQAYERLVNWLRNNPGCYNGDLMLLQMTTEIGEHLGSLPSSEQADVMAFISNQLSAPSGSAGNGTLLESILNMAAEGAAVYQPTLEAGKTSANNFLQQFINMVGPLSKYGAPFSTLEASASNLQGGPIDSWCNSHYVTYYDPANPSSSRSTWVDDIGRPILSFSSFANMAAFTIGTLINNSNAQSTIDAYYQQEIDQLVAEIHDPMMLLAALMNLINQRDQDNGQAVNGYGNNLSVLQQANSLVGKLLGDLSGSSPDAADFFSTLQQLRTLVEQDPALTSMVNNLENDIGTINNQAISALTFYHNSSYLSWNATPGYYTFPPNTEITYNGVQVIVSGVVYLDGGSVQLSQSNMPDAGYTFAQLAAMGNTSAIQATMSGWSSTVMSNFENGVTGIQTLLNGASPAIQQQIQNTTQTMQAEENFEKEAYDSITNLNNQIMKLIQQVMG